MTQLPAAGYPSTTTRTNTEIQNFLEDVLAKMKEMPGGQDIQAATISGGIVTSINPIIELAPEGGTFDYLDRINDSAEDGAIKILRGSATAIIMVRNNAVPAVDGNILTSTNREVFLNNQKDFVMFRKDGTDWVEIFRKVLENRVVLYNTAAETGIVSGASLDWDAAGDPYLTTDTPAWVVGTPERLIVPEGVKHVFFIWSVGFAASEGGVFRQIECRLVSGGNDWGQSIQLHSYVSGRVNWISGVTGLFNVVSADYAHLIVTHDGTGNISVPSAEFNNHFSMIIYD